MKIKIVAIFVLLILGSDYGSANLNNVPTSSEHKSIRFIDKAISMGKQFTNFIEDNFLSIGQKLQENFYAARNRLIKAEKELMTGAFTNLSEMEIKVNNIFMKHKLHELNLGQNNTNFHAAGLHFFKAKPIIEKSKIFQFLRKMPKGAILHIHNSASVSSDWVVRNMSYMPGLLRCNNKNGISILSFRKSEKHECVTSYAIVNKERKDSYNTTIYDQSFEKLLNLYTPTPEMDYPSIDPVWKKFQNMFSTLSDAIAYLDAFRAYHWQMLKEMYDDNIMYAEVRLAIHELYDRHGRKYGKERTIRELIKVVNQFRIQHPKFLGIKIIVNRHRNINNEMLLQNIQEFQQIQSKFPDFIVGFDLAGQEDKGKPLINFAESLQRSPHTTYFFHAGETNNFGTSTDYNLFDAILLNTKRIGHGYMLMKHPLLRQIVKARQIAIEVCPISSQVLHLVADLRNHPAGIFLSENIPIVISNDDPGFWNAKGLSYDFYYAIMSFAPQESGLEVLKTLALNSLKFSSLNKYELQNALSRWEQDWRIFLNDVLKGKVI